MTDIEIHFNAPQGATPEELAAYLDHACQGDADLRARVEALFAAEENAGPDFLEGSPLKPLQDGGSTVIEENQFSEGVGNRIGRYKLLEQIGEGGFGTVWAAEQQTPVRRRVALKIIKPGMDSRQVVARFEAERQALAMMDHPNISRVLDAGTAPSGRPFFVMELVPGVPITQFCDEHRLTTRQRVALFITVCRAVQHAHQKGIIHRDLKPSNILVAERDGQPVPKVIDFGIAKATQGELTDKTIYTQLQQLIGTPAYMSPEQAEMNPAEAGDIDTRSDIYSLGVLLYELLTSRTPFDGRELVASGLDAMRRTIREKYPPRPSARYSSLHGEELTTTARRRGSDPPKLIHLLQGDLDWIVMKALEKDRTRRYETANGLAMDLQRHLDDEPVVARPPSELYRLRKLMRRNQLAFAAAGALAVVLFLGILISTNQAIRAKRAEKTAGYLLKETEIVRDRIQEQRRIAVDRLYDTLVREAHATRLARHVGYRPAVFELLRQARELDTPRRDLVELRREAAACMGDFVGLEPRSLGAFSGIVDLVALNPGGTLGAFLEWGPTNAISIRNMADGRELARPAEAGNCLNLAFDPSGRQLVSLWSTGDPAANTLHIWQITAGRQVQPVLAERVVPGTFALTPGDNSLLLWQTDNDGNETRVVSFEKGDTIARLAARVRPEGSAVGISPDGLIAAIETVAAPGDFDSAVELWDLTRSERLHRWEPHQGQCYALVISPDAGHLAVVTEPVVLIYDLNSGQLVNVFSGYFQTKNAAFSPDRTSLVLPLPHENALRVVNFRAAAELAYLQLPDQPSKIGISQDGSLLVASYLHGVLVFPFGEGPEVRRFTGHPSGVPAVVFSPDGTHLVSAGKDRTLRLWEVATGRQIRLVDTLDLPAQSLALSPDGALLAAGDFGSGRVIVWSLADNQRVLELSGPDPEVIWSCAFSPDGRYLLAAGPGLSIWELGTDPTLSARLVHRSLGHFRNLEFAQDGREFAFFGRSDDPPVGRGVFVCDMSPGFPIKFVGSGNRGNVQDVAFLPDNQTLLYINTNRVVRAWNRRTGDLNDGFPTLTEPGAGGSFAANLRASPDGSRLAIASHNALGVDLWDTTGHRIYSLPNGRASVWWLAWTPDGKQLAAARSNGEIELWQLDRIDEALMAVGMETP